MNNRNPLSKLRTQLVVTFLVGSLAIVIAIGLPVVLLINRQAVTQTSLLLDQAVLTTQASLAREQTDLQNLALLISQRPTLKRLLEEQGTSALNSYLDTLRESVNLDHLIVCSANGEMIAASPGSERSDLCNVQDQGGFLPASQGQDSLMFTTGEVQNTSSSYRVVVGKNIASVLSRLQEETGMLYLLASGGRLIQSSDQAEALSSLSDGTTIDSRQSPGKWIRGRDGRTYALAKIALPPGSDLTLTGALNVDEQVQAQANLSQTLILGLVFILLIAFGLGVWLSQRFSSPLDHLANAAANFSHGNLHTPVSVRSGTWEIGQLANTLEDARVALQHSMAQLQSEKAWVEHILNSIVEGILTMDGQNRITFASAGMLRIADCEPEEMIAQNINDIFLPVESEIPFSEQLPDPGRQISISVKLNNRQEKLLSISRVRLVPPEERSSSHALVIRDVSNEEYIHRLLGDFLANITHEFRTPLAALEASTELLLDNLYHLSQPELEELLISLNLGIIDLQTLIDNLIEAASIEAGRFKVSQRPVVFESILRDALKIIQPLADKYRLTLSVSAHAGRSILVMADHRRTVQVLVNLLSNAVKHSPEGGQIQVEYSVDGQSLHVDVIDEGSGIPMDRRSILFKRFAHLDSPDERARQGAGLGLSVVKAIVEAQRGQVGIKDREERGTSFWFTLPLADEDGQ